MYLLGEHLDNISVQLAAFVTIVFPLKKNTDAHWKGI